MSSLLIGLLGALVATNQPAAVSNVLRQTTGLSVKLPDPTDPVEKEYKRLLEADDEAQAEAEKRMNENGALPKDDAGLRGATASLRLRQRLEQVRKDYEDFLLRHPQHARARLAYGSFLEDLGREAEAVYQWEKARELDPSNPAVWNNLANYYGHRGPVTNAFIYYAKAIELNPQEPLYYQNFATTVYLFRQDAMAMYHIDEQQVFDRALELYRRALKLDPDSFVLANDLAQSYYGIKPPRTEEALRAWEYTLKTAKDELQREGVYVHLARNEILLGRFDRAREHLAAVTNQTYAILRERLLRNLATKEGQAKTNAPPPVKR